LVGSLLARIGAGILLARVLLAGDRVLLAGVRVLAGILLARVRVLRLWKSVDVCRICVVSFVDRVESGTQGSARYRR
jgi:hypothetical protein